MYCFNCPFCGFVRGIDWMKVFARNMRGTRFLQGENMKKWNIDKI